MTVLLQIGFGASIVAVVLLAGVIVVSSWRKR